MLTRSHLTRRSQWQRFQNSSCTQIFILRHQVFDEFSSVHRNFFPLVDIFGKYTIFSYKIFFQKERRTLTQIKSHDRIIIDIRPAVQACRTLHDELFIFDVSSFL
jgi:hypothetical protein